jgi:hypothetical protein
MNVQFLTLLILITIVSLSFAANEHYPRPWENKTWMEENQYAHSFFDALFLGSLGSQLPEATLLEGLLNKSIPDFQEGLEQMQLEELDAELGMEGKANSDIDEAIEWKGHADEIAIGVEDLVPGKYGLDVWSYPGNWKNCINSSLLALEGYAGQINQKQEEFESWRSKLEYAGVCDDDYSGRSIEYCSMPLEDAECGISGIWEDAPQFEWYYGCMHTHWETISALDAKITGISLSYAETVDLCTDSKKEASLRKAGADAKYSAIEREELESIYRSSYGEGNSGAMGVKGRYETLAAIKESADSAYFLAENAGEGDSQWLKNCIVGSGNALSGYELIVQSSILEEAESVVEEYGEEAWERLEGANEAKNEMGVLGQDRLGVARKECNSGETAPTLGQRFVHYGKCIKYSNMAMESAEDGDGAVEAYIAAEISWLKTLLSNAEKDNIDTHIERTQLAILEKEKPANALEISENIEESILEKAEHKYNWLEKKRAGLKTDILLGGPQFSYVDSWFDVGEECYSGNALDYSCALGHLDEMGRLYLEIESGLWEQKDLLVTSSLVIDEQESLGLPILNEPSEVYLYVDITNPTKFDGGDIVVEIPTGFEFRKMDLVSDPEPVRMVTPSKNKIEIYLAGIGPGETIHLQFKKEQVICSSKSYVEKAFGDNMGGATVQQTLKIECKYEVGGIVLGDGFEAEEAIVSGLRVELEDGCVPATLAKGVHTIEMNQYDYDAYEMEREPVFVSTLGQTTKIEMFFKFEPNRDLEYIAYSSVEEGKDLGKLDVFGYTGEKITKQKTVGENTIFFNVHDLIKGKETTVRVSYEISEMEEYLNGQLLYYSAQNLTEEEELLLTQAKNYLLADENAGAYQAIEELRSKIEKKENTQRKVLEKHGKICEKIKEKIASLSAAVGLAKELGVENTLISEMGARLGELENALETEVAPDALVGPLESFDLNWEKRELTKISKELLKLEKEAKGEWAKTGMDNQEVESAIDEIEQKNSQFSGSLGFEDGVRAFYAISLATQGLAKLAEEENLLKTGNQQWIENALESGYDLLADYTREYTEADGTHIKGMFPKKPSEINKAFKEAGSSTEYGDAVSTIDELMDEMQGTLDLLEAEERRTAENLEGLYYEVKDEMSDTDAAFVEAALQNAGNYAAKGEYVRAIKSLEDGIRRLQTFEKKQDGLLVLAITGLLVLGVIALYLLKDQIPKNIFSKKEEKKYRKLKREPPSP